jgi:hypothetical protein
MTRIAFYAPLKSPDDPVPSGDREMARNLMAAIAADGAQVDLVSHCRVHDKTGDAAYQADARARAAAEIARLVPLLRGNDTALWVTYHNYSKAPDLIGPTVAAALNIPYVQIESSRAHKRLTGPWAGFAAAAEAACDAAATIFYQTANDLITLKRHRPDDQNLIRLWPFLPTDALPPAATCDGPILAAGMMRPGDKLASYRIIAEALAHLAGDWRLDIAGDGPARAQVADLMAPFGARVRFLGQLDRSELARAYQDAALFLWPGVNEAYGMVYLEAQAAGLPVVAQNRPGVRDVLLKGQYPKPRDGAAALAAEITTLLADRTARRARGAQARAMIARRHLAPAATVAFWAGVAPLLRTIR